LTNLVYELRPAALDGRPLADALGDFALRWAEHNRVDVMLNVEKGPPLPPEVEQALLRIAQEALANVARHSGARQVTVGLDTVGAESTLAIGDDGCGFDASTVQRGVGLDSMRERAGAIGAELTVASAAGSGTRISVVWRNCSWQTPSPL
jgi:signal transduction histidine kinase